MPPTKVEPESDFGLFAARLRELRTSLGKTQHEFADMLGVSRSFLADVENLRSRAGLDLVLSLLKARFEVGGADHFVNPDWLLFGTGFKILANRSLSDRFTDLPIKDYDFDLLRQCFDLITEYEGRTGNKLQGNQLRDVALRLFVQLWSSARTLRRGEDSEAAERRAEAEGRQMLELLIAAASPGAAD